MNRKALKPPGTAEPFVKKVSLEQEGSPYYVVLMTDGVYKAEEAVKDSKDTIADTIWKVIKDKPTDLDNSDDSKLAETIVKDLSTQLEQTFKENVKDPQKLPLPAALCKRDDMTLVVLKVTMKNQTSDIEKDSTPV